MNPENSVPRHPSNKHSHVFSESANFALDVTSTHTTTVSNLQIL